MTFKTHRYPKDWKAIRASIMARAGDTCECTGQCGDAHEDGRCAAPHLAIVKRRERTPAVWWLHDGCTLCAAGDPTCRPVKIILTVAHVDHDEQNNDPRNLLALCQRCHLVMDGANNVARKRERRAVEGGQRPLPLLAVLPEHREVRRG